MYLIDAKELVLICSETQESISWLTVPETDYFYLIQNTYSINYKGKGSEKAGKLCKMHMPLKCRLQVPPS